MPRECVPSLWVTLDSSGLSRNWKFRRANFEADFRRLDSNSHYELALPREPISKRQLRPFRCRRPDPAW